MSPALSANRPIKIKPIKTQPHIPEQDMKKKDNELPWVEGWGTDLIGKIIAPIITKTEDDLPVHLPTFSAGGGSQDRIVRGGDYPNDVHIDGFPSQAKNEGQVAGKEFASQSKNPVQANEASSKHDPRIDPDTFVDHGRVTSDYLEKRDNEIHQGVDIGPPTAGQTGVDVKAGVEGKIESFGPKDNTVNIRMSDGTLVQLMHLASFNKDLKPGDKVTPETIVGKMGGFGNGNPNEYDIHLHIQVKDKNDRIKNPVDYLWPDEDSPVNDNKHPGSGG